MKIATLTDSYKQTHKDVFLLQDMADYDEFEQLSQDANEDEVIFALKTDVPESRWNHMFNGGLGAMTVGVQHANTLGGNPILLSGMYLDNKLARIKSLINDGVEVAINKKGGYFPCYDFMEIKILEIKEYEQDKSQYVDIPEDTKIINLENDLDLEPVAIKYMEERDSNYSSIRKLRLFSERDLVAIFTKFKKNGGETAYIYTTGTDVQQMYDYTKALMLAGINKIVFDFNSGITPEIEKFLEDTKIYDIEVKIING